MMTFGNWSLYFLIFLSCFQCLYHFVLASKTKFYQHPNSVCCIFNFCNCRLNFLEDFFFLFVIEHEFVPYPILVLRLQCSSILLRLLRNFFKKIQIFLPFAYFCYFKAFYYVLSFVSVLIPDASFPEWLSYSGGNQMSIINGPNSYLAPI